MKGTRLALVVGMAAIGMVALRAQALPQVGVSENTARAELLRSLDSGNVNYSLAAKAFKAASGAVRAQLATAAVAWAQAYTATPVFQQTYAAHREQMKPDPPRFEGTPEEQIEKTRLQQEKSLEESRKSIDKMPPEHRKMMEEALKASEDAIRQMQTPEMIKMQLDGIRMQRDAEMESYKTDLKEWETEYPASPSPMIARRLREFLAASADVNYDAKLEARDGLMRFVDPAYEKKDANWKLCYRAGRETVEAARSAAQAWLKTVQ